MTISLLQSIVSLRKIFISKKFREVSAHKPLKQTLIMEDIQEKYNHLLHQNEVLKTEDIHPPKTGISVHFSGSLV